MKNGDRWIITQISRQGDLTVRHTRNHTQALGAVKRGPSHAIGYGRLPAATHHLRQPGATLGMEAFPNGECRVPKVSPQTPIEPYEAITSREPGRGPQQ